VVPPAELPGDGTDERPTSDDDLGHEDADLVRGRLGSYQRGLVNARRERVRPDPDPAFDPVGAGLFTATGEPRDAAGDPEQGGDQ
jgi:hypothetical protein